MCDNLSHSLFHNGGGKRRAILITVQNTKQQCVITFLHTLCNMLNRAKTVSLNKAII